VRTFFGKRGGFFRCGHPHFLAQKPSVFSKFLVCVHGQVEGVEPVRIFYGQMGKGVKFSRFCADVLYGRLLSFCIPFVIYIIMFKKSNLYFVIYVIECNKGDIN